MSTDNRMNQQQSEKDLSRSNNAERESAQLTLGAAAPALISESELPSTKRPITRAEKLFDTALYGGLMGVFNAVYSVWLGDQVREGHGKAFFEHTAEQIAQRMVPRNAPAKQLEETMQRIKHTNINVVLTGCGIMLLFPMKWFENRKPQFVRWIHEKFTRPDDPEKAAKDEAALKQLDNTPVLGWGPIATGRAVGMVGPFTVSWYGAKYVQHAEDAVAKFAEHDLKLRSPQSIRYARMISLELLYTGICTAGLYVYTHFIKPPKQKQESDSAAPKEPKEPLAMVTPENRNEKPCARCRLKKQQSYAERVSRPATAEAPMEVAL